MSLVTTDVVKEVALLARLQLEGKDLERMAAQLDQILEYVRQLDAVPTDGIEPTSHVLQLTNVLRLDEPRPSLSAEAVVNLAPATHQQFVAVPKVIEA